MGNSEIRNSYYWRTISCVFSILVMISHNGKLGQATKFVRSFYETLGSPRFISAPMVDQSSLVRDNE